MLQSCGNWTTRHAASSTSACAAAGSSPKWNRQSASSNVCSRPGAAALHNVAAAITAWEIKEFDVARAITIFSENKGDAMRFLNHSASSASAARR